MFFVLCFECVNDVPLMHFLFVLYSCMCYVQLYIMTCCWQEIYSISPHQMTCAFLHWFFSVCTIIKLFSYIIFIMMPSKWCHQRHCFIIIAVLTAWFPILSELKSYNQIKTGRPVHLNGLHSKQLTTWYVWLL